MTAHTPLPWKVTGSDGIFHIVTIDGDDIIRCIGINGEDTLGRSEANARFIVTACNCYEKLVQALEEHSIYFLATNGEELFDQPLNWEAILLQEIREAEDQFNAS